MTLQLATGLTGSTGWLAAPAHGAEILVDSSADLIATDGDCTLREAIFAANQNTPQDGCAAGDDDDDRIVFQGSRSIVLDSDLPAITAPVRIVGVDRDSAFVFGGPDIQAFFINAGGRQDIVRLERISVGLCSGRGAVLATNVTLQLEDVSISFNQKTGGGGAVSVHDGALEIFDSTLSYNDALGIAGSGGAIALLRSRLYIRNSLLEHNEAEGAGGAVSASDLGVSLPDLLGVTIEGTVIAYNTAVSSAGGLGLSVSEGNGDVMIRDSWIHDNTAAGATLSHGGGLSANRAVLDRVTLEGNSADLGGGVYISGTGSLTNVTLDGNLASEGLAVATETGYLTLNHATIANHTSATAGVLYVKDFENTIEVGNSILDNPGALECKKTSTARLDSRGYNVVEDGSCVFAQPGDLQNTSAALGPLTDNLGLAPTREPTAGSPAIDSANVPGAIGPALACAAEDARRLRRPWDGDGNGSALCDRGAHEVGPVDIFADDLESGNTSQWSGSVP